MTSSSATSPQMRAVLNAGVRLHHVVSAHPVKFWVTEFGWDTNPPRKQAAPLSVAARWTAESLHQMWLSGVSLVTWFLLEDYPQREHVPERLVLPCVVARERPAEAVRTAFRFPFVAYLHGSTVSVWGRVATSDNELVTVQRRHGKRGAWRTVALVRSNASRDLQGGAQTERVEGGLASRRRCRFREVARVLAHGPARSQLSRPRPPVPLRP